MAGFARSTSRHRATKVHHLPQASGGSRCDFGEAVHNARNALPHQSAAEEVCEAAAVAAQNVVVTSLPPRHHVTFDQLQDLRGAHVRRAHGDGLPVYVHLVGPGRRGGDALLPEGPLAAVDLNSSVERAAYPQDVMEQVVRVQPVLVQVIHVQEDAAVAHDLGARIVPVRRPGEGCAARGVGGVPHGPRRSGSADP